MENIWQSAKEGHKHLALIFEEEEAYLGREVHLHLNDIISFLRVNVNKMMS